MPAEPAQSVVAEASPVAIAETSLAQALAPEAQKFEEIWRPRRHQRPERSERPERRDGPRREGGQGRHHRHHGPRPAQPAANAASPENSAANAAHAAVSQAPAANNQSDRPSSAPRSSIRSPIGSARGSWRPRAFRRPEERGPRSQKRRCEPAAPGPRQAREWAAAKNRRIAADDHRRAAKIGDRRFIVAVRSACRLESQNGKAERRLRLDLIPGPMRTRALCNASISGCGLPGSQSLGHWRRP